MLRRSLKRWNRPVPVQRRTGSYPHYNLCVIGGGPAGIAAATRAASIDKKVCIVESGRLGGRDIWNGTLQSKLLWELGQFVSRMTTQPGFVDLVLDPAVVPTIKNAVSGARVQEALLRASEAREAMARDTLNCSDIDVLHGKASFRSEREVDVHLPATGEYRVLTADYFLIATGSTPAEHPICVADHKHIVNSDDIFTLPVPKSLVVVGAGPMGCEFASMYASLGLTKVSLVDRAPRILPKEDADVAARVQASLTRKGVTVHQGCQLFDLESRARGDAETVLYSVQNSHTGTVESWEVERALVTLGRVPNYAGLGLENTRMRVSNGYLAVDEHNRCLPYDHIYCVGDAGNERKVVNLAQSAARLAVQDMYSLAPRHPSNTGRVRSVATTMFLDEEVACVGLNEKQCQEQKISYLVSKFENSFLARAEVMGATEGFVKLIVTNDREKRVLGVRAIGSHAASVVEVASLAVREHRSVYELLRLNPAYPSMVAGLIECARMVVGRGNWNTACSRKGMEMDGMTVREWQPDSCDRGRAFCDGKGTSRQPSPPQ